MALPRRDAAGDIRPLRPSRLKIRWDDVPEAGDVAKQQADALAAQFNQGGGGQAIQAGGADVSGIVEALQQAMPGAGTGAASGATPAGDDTVAQPERLAKLKDSGALTEQEFEREKARILGSG